MADDQQQLSSQDLDDLKDIATRLPVGHPMQGKISLLLNSQPTHFEQQHANPNPAAQPGAFQSTKGGDIQNANDLDETGGQMVHRLLLTGANKVSGWVDRTDQANLSKAARGEGPGPIVRSTWGPRAVRSALQVGADMTTPKGAALTTGIALANTNPITGVPVDAALAVHGGYGVYQNRQALKDFATTGQANPDQLESGLNSAGEAVGGLAGTGAQGRALLRARTASAPARGLNLLERTTSPGGMKAEGQLESRLTNQRAAPYLAEQERATPVLNKQPATIGSKPNPLAGQDMGVMNYRQNAQAAGQQLWGQIEPRARMYNRALLEPTKQGVTASVAVRSTLNPTEAQLNPGKVAGVQSLADFYDKPQTVGEALQRIQELNNDKGVQAYEKALPDKQAELLKGDPTIEGKITAANTMRDQVFDSIEKHGSAEDANWIRNARQDYGAITEVGKNLGNAQVPTPQPFLARLANSARLAISPTFAREYLSRPVSTLLDLNNPNRLAMKSSRALGASDLAPGSPPPIRTTPWTPTPRPGPVVGPIAGAPAPFTGGTRALMMTPPQMPVPPGPGRNVALFPDIPSGQAPHATLGAGEVPNWPPKTPDWSPVNTASPVPSAESTIPPTSPYSPSSEQGPPPLPPGITADQWNALPAAARNKFGNSPPTPGAYSPGAATDVTPQGAQLPSATPPISVASQLPSAVTSSGAPTPMPSSGTPVVQPTQGAEVAPTPSQIPYAGSERRTSMRDITGPSDERINLMRYLGQKAASGDKLAAMQLADMQAHPFESAQSELGGVDINSMKPQRTMSKAEAEANAAKRASGRNARFSSEAPQ